ncbi:TPA: hypothetical protein JAG55_003023 [Legionella pneumophila]|nr:hypothetical protein [Legionella pneumophila]HAT5950228.1 hypothetical protein [Legionella pneumophila]HAT5973346.1 hypothetical protein [Legionella pneumophila]HAT5982573.1 hypothetical protein [Legionella pneumophila]HAT6093462.1 hypothetical protein [Legionella pneumophila]
MVDVKKLLGKRDNSKLYDEIRKETKPKLDVNRLCRMRNDAKSDLDMWRSILQTAYHYAMPDYNPFENYGLAGFLTPGQQYNADIYDLTLPIAHKRLADKMLMNMVPQGQQWVKFTPGDEFGEPGTPLYQRALDATQRMTDHFFKILDRSNFYLAVGESLQDVLISTGILAINEGNRKKPVRYEAVPPAQVMFQGDAEGQVDAIFRDWYQVRIENIKSMWPKADVSRLNKKPDDKIDIWECAWIDYEAPEKERYQYVVMTSSKDVLLEQSNSSWPWVVYRMRRLTGEIRGRGPSLSAYPTAATINQALEDELVAAAFQANPMYMAASDSAFNQQTFTPRPGSIVPVQMVQGEWPIKPFEQSGNIQFNALLVNDFRQQINDLLYAFPLGAVNAPNRTATEAEIRYTDNLESFSAMVPRLQNEFFIPVIQRTLWVINKVLPETFANIPDDIRNKMISVDGQILGLSFDTPLMTAKGQVKTAALLGFYQAAASLLGPEAATASLDPVEVITNLADNQGIDIRNIKTREQLEQLLQAAGQIAEQQAAQQGVIIDSEQPQQ